MTVVLPRDYEGLSSVEDLSIPWMTEDQASREDIRALRIGLLNVMSLDEDYEAGLLHPLGRSVMQIEPVWIRLKNFDYPNANEDHLNRYYVPFEEAIANQRLDGLILTGDPVKGVPLEELAYWPELERILRYARNNIISTLGICWGAQVLAGSLGIPRIELPRHKVGIFQARNLDDRHYVMCAMDDIFDFPYSSSSSIDNAAMEAARDEQRVQLLAHSEAVGYVIAQSADSRYLMHFGHPEYEPAHMVRQYEMQRSQNEATAEVPVGLALDSPTNTWRGHRNAFFSTWIKNIHEQTSF